MFTLTAFVLASLSGCGGSQRGPNTIAAPRIKVIDPGSEPRQRLQYELTAHAPERMEMTFKLRMNTAYTNTVLETGHRSADFPTIKNTARIEVASIGGDGTATVNSVLEDVVVLDDVVDPAIRKAVDSEVKAMKGSQGSWHMTRSGQISDVLTSAPNVTGAARNRLSSFADTIRETAVTFPDEAIGIGATWQVTTEHVVSAVKWERTTTYRLKALAGSAATVEAHVAMHADSQAISVEPNATTRLTSATSNATAELIVPLHGLVVTATAQGTSEMNLLIVRGHLRITSSLQSEALSSVKPVSIATPPGPGSGP